MSSGTPGDPQQHRVYKMEQEFAGTVHARLEVGDIKALCNDVAKAYCVPRPIVSFRKMANGLIAQCYPDGRIEFRDDRRFWSTRVILHELAHHIHNWAIKKAHEHEAHGPEFMACYMHVLDAARVIPVVGMRAICKKFKVRYIDPGEGSSLSSLKRRLR